LLYKAEARGVSAIQAVLFHPAPTKFDRQPPQLLKLRSQTGTFWPFCWPNLPHQPTSVE